MDKDHPATGYRRALQKVTCFFGRVCIRELRNLSLHVYLFVCGPAVRKAKNFLRLFGIVKTTFTRGIEDKLLAGDKFSFNSDAADFIP